jgi:hypothetical protein
MRSISHIIGPVEAKRFAAFSVALCLALAGAGVGLVVARDHRDKAAGLALNKDAPEQQDSSDGWRAFSALATPMPRTTAGSPLAAASPNPVDGTPNQSAITVGLGGSSGTSGVAGASGAPSTAGTGGVHASPTNSPQSGAIGNVAIAVANDALSSGVVAGVPAASASGGVATAAGSAVPSGQQPPATAAAPEQVPRPNFNYSQQSVICGSSTCNLGQVCCNSSCGTCAAPGATCDQARCDNAISYPTSQACGMSTCNIDTVCCNPSCGTCVAPGAQCSQAPCG